MQFFEASLGVGCNYCHAPERDKDTERKDIARKMVQMVHAVNRDTFEGDAEVTCYTCHRGQVGATGKRRRSPLPNTAPGSLTSPNGLPNARAGRRAPRPAQIIDKWFPATLGGPDSPQQVHQPAS